MLPFCVSKAHHESAVVGCVLGCDVRRPNHDPGCEAGHDEAEDELGEGQGSPEDVSLNHRGQILSGNWKKIMTIRILKSVQTNSDDVNETILKAFSIVRISRLERRRSANPSSHWQHNGGADNVQSVLYHESMRLIAITPSATPIFVQIPELMKDRSTDSEHATGSVQIPIAVPSARVCHAICIACSTNLEFLDELHINNGPKWTMLICHPVGEGSISFFVCCKPLKHQSTLSYIYRR